MASAQINYLVLIRHGQSEGNVAQRLVRSGRMDEIPPAFFDVPNREYRLTSTGVAQCQLTGEYLGRAYPDRFRRIVTADFVRSTETMVHTLTAAGWTDAEVTTEALYGERIWGTMPREQQALLAEMEIRKRDPMNWRTPGGETLTFTRLRARVLLDRAKREFAGESMLVFTHGEFIESILAEVLHLDTESFIEFRESKLGNIDNCQVIELSSIDPETGRPTGKLRWIRSSNPHKGQLGEWQRIERKKYQLEELRKRVAGYPQFLG